MVPTGASWEMVTETGAEVEAENAVLPAYEAVSGSVPTGNADVVTLALPLDREAVPSAVVPM